METIISNDSYSEWTCHSCTEMRNILCFLKSQEGELAKINEVAVKVSDLSQNFADFKNLVPKMIAEQIESAVTAVQQDVVSIVNPLKTELQKSLFDNYRAERNKVRADIIISGIPESIKNVDELVQLVIKIGIVYEVNLPPQEIYQCKWIKSGGDTRKLLVTFNSLISRDKIMRKYFKDNTKLELNQIFPCEVSNRVYLNNNNPAKANKLYLYSRKLKKKGVIKNFKMDYSIGTVEITSCSDEISKFSDLGGIVAKYPVHQVERTNMNVN